MRTNIISDVAELGKLIEGITSRGKRLDGDIHIAAMSAVSHFAQHGDDTYVNRLYIAMPKGSRHVALTEWLLQFGGVMANEDKGTNKKRPFCKDGNKAVNLEDGDKTPWFTMKASKAPDEVIDLLKLTLAVIKKAASPKEGQEVAHGEMLADLQALAEKFAPVDEVADATADPQG
jgi:hypothetical protein